MEPRLKSRWSLLLLLQQSNKTQDYTASAMLPRDNTLETNYVMLASGWSWNTCAADRKLSHQWQRNGITRAPPRPPWLHAAMIDTAQLSSLLRRQKNGSRGVVIRHNNCR